MQHSRLSLRPLTSPECFLYHSLSLSLRLYQFLPKYFSQYLLTSFFLSAPPPSLSVSLSPAGQTAAELLQERSIVRYGTAS